MRADDELDLVLVKRSNFTNSDKLIHPDLQHASIRRLEEPYPEESSNGGCSSNGRLTT